MADLSELLLLKSVDYAEYQKIAPYLSALPADSKLNINTAPAEIIQSIAVYIDESTAQQVVASRGETGFTSLSDFLSGEVFKENQDSSVLLAQLSVTSNWFELYTSVTLQDRTLTQRSMLHRDSSGMTLTLRDRSVKEANPIPGDPIKGPAASADLDYSIVPLRTINFAADMLLTWLALASIESLPLLLVTRFCSLLPISNYCYDCRAE